MPALGIPKIRLSFSPSKARWPDLWTDGKTITVTREWVRQNAGERRKRLVHELCHLKGLQHGQIGGLDFNTVPRLDTYGKAVYQRIVGNPPFALAKTEVSAREVETLSHRLGIPVFAVKERQVQGPYTYVSELKRCILNYSLKHHLVVCLPRILILRLSAASTSLLRYRSTSPGCLLLNG